MSTAAKKRIVRIGGGSSGYTLLRALKEYPFDITAVVTMFDSGGSSGVLRDELGILPPGDVRRALAALAEGERGEILRELFNFRFNEEGSVNGHSFGNLFLAALSALYGSDIEAIRKASLLLGITGKVLPVSLDSATIHAILSNGAELIGETNIDIPRHDASLGIQRVFLDPPPHLFVEADQVIRDADMVVIGPGDLYSSIIPNLLVDGMPRALKETQAKIVIICNLMTKQGETDGYSAGDMVREVLKYAGLQHCHIAICNTGTLSPVTLDRYALKQQFPMEYDETVQQQVGRVIMGDFASESDVARHDPTKIAKTLSEIVVS